MLPHRNSLVGELQKLFSGDERNACNRVGSLKSYNQRWNRTNRAEFDLGLIAALIILGVDCSNEVSAMAKHLKMGTSEWPWRTGGLGSTLTGKPNIMVPFCSLLQYVYLIVSLASWVWCILHGMWKKLTMIVSTLQLWIIVLSQCRGLNSLKTSLSSTPFRNVQTPRRRVSRLEL